MKKVWKNPWHFLAFGFGLGLLPKAPGTFGSLLGLLFYWLLVSLGWEGYLFIPLLAMIFGVWLCGKVSKDLGVHDHSGIVWDEIVGILLTFVFISPSLNAMLAGFIFFRFFDILKPWPISYVDKKIHGGLGIMLDDVLAAIPSWLCLQIYLFLFGINFS